MRKLKLLSATVAALLAVGPASSFADVPPECAVLFVEAGHANNQLVRKGQETAELAMAGLDRRLPEDYVRLAEGVTQLLDAQTSFYKKLLAAIQCLEPNTSNNILPMSKTNGKICFPSEVCPESWEEYEGVAGGHWEFEEGWYCPSRQRFCWTEGAGDACACSTKTPSKSAFVKLRAVR